MNYILAIFIVLTWAPIAGAQIQWSIAGNVECTHADGDNQLTIDGGACGVLSGGNILTITDDDGTCRGAGSERVVCVYNSTATDYDPVGDDMGDVDTLGELNTALGSSIADGAHTSDTNTNASTECTDAEVLEGSGSCVANSGAAPGSDSIGTDELDDGANSPGSGEFVRVDTVDQAGFDYRSTAEVLSDIGADSASNLTTGTIPADRVGAAHVDVITEIDSGLKSGADASLITGTAGTNGNCSEWNADGDLVDSGAACAGSESDPIFGAMDTLGELNTQVSASIADGAHTTVGADHIDTITEIAAALKAGADGTLLTGTAGTNGNCSEWNADGDLVDSGASCGNGSGATTSASGVTYPTATTDDFCVGGTTTANSDFCVDVGTNTMTMRQQSGEVGYARVYEDPDDGAHYTGHAAPAGGFAGTTAFEFNTEGQFDPGAIELDRQQCSPTISSPSAATHVESFLWAYSAEAQEVYCYTVGGGTSTATVQLVRRDRSTPDSSGSDMLGTLVCDEDGETTTTISPATVATTQLVVLDIDAVANAPDSVKVCVRATVN